MEHPKQNLPGQPLQFVGPHSVPSAPNQFDVTPHVLGVPDQFNAVPHVPGAPNQYNVAPHVPGNPVQFNVAVHVPGTPVSVLQPWTTSLCGCCEDCGSCCLTCWCPCVTFGRIVNVTDRGLTTCCGSGTLYCILCLLMGFQWIYSCIYRRNLRMLYNLPETPCCDCCVQYCCECCSLCQMYRELQNRGYNMSTGNLENMSRVGQVNMQPPQGPGAMMR